MFAFLRLGFSFILFIIPALSVAETQGVAYFAAQGFTKKECFKALKVFNGVETPALSFLWNTFNRGSYQGCVQEYLRRSLDKKHYLQIHFSNESARALKRAGPYELLAQYDSKKYSRQLTKRRLNVLNAVRKRAKKINLFIDKHGNQNTVLLVSTGLEDRLTTSAFMVLVEQLRSTLPQNTVLLRNPVGGHENNTIWSGADLIELHGLKPKFRQSTGQRCIANFDGEDIRFRDSASRPGNDHSSLPVVLSTVRKLRERGCFVFWWWPGPQGRGKAVKFVDPRKRVFQFDSKVISIVNKNLRKNL